MTLRAALPPYAWTRITPGRGGSKRIPGHIEGETTDSNAAAGSVHILPAFTLRNHRQQNV
jgi:hypothetical protein